MTIFVLEDEIDSYPRVQIKEALKGHEVVYAKSYKDGVAKYKGPYDLLLLDHDMEGYIERSEHPNTGYQFVKWFVEQHKGPKPRILLHSQNSVGRKNMRLLLEERNFVVQEVPFGPTYVKALKEQL